MIMNVPIEGFMNVPSEGLIRNTMPTKLDICMFTHKRYNLRQYTK